VRDEAREAVREVDRVVAAGDAHVHVLAEDGELLGEVAVERGDVAEALGRIDAPLVPAVERDASRRPATARFSRSAVATIASRTVRSSRSSSS
jgi:hypothetical protein